MDEEAVFASDFEGDLTDGFEEGLALDVADRAADLGDHHVRVGLLAHAVDKRLDLVRHMGDDLHGRAEVFPSPLLVQHVPVDLAGGEVGEAVEVLVDEAFVVTEVEVGFRAVLGDVDLAVLVGAHRAGVDVDVRVELLRGDLESARFEQPSERRSSDALAQPGDHASGYEDVLCHGGDTSHHIIFSDRSSTCRRHS